MDLAIRRAFKLREGMALQFSGEMFNLTNHPNFGEPGSSLGTLWNGDPMPNTMFGTVTRMLSAPSGSKGSSMLSVYAFGGQRDFQFAVKLTF